MKQSMKSYMAGFLTCLLLCMTVVTAMADGDQAISATLKGTIKMKLYGKDFTPKETDGSYVLPISYNGRTYLPVRSLTEALNVPVEWDATTQTIWMGGKIENVPVDSISQYENYYGTIITKDAAMLSAPGKAYKWGVVNDKPVDMAYFSAYLKPEGKYKTFTASVFMDEAVKQDLVFEIRKDKYDGEVIKSYTLKPGQTVDIEADIAGVQKICLISNVMIGHGKVDKLIVGEPMFKNNTVSSTNPAAGNIK